MVVLPVPGAPEIIVIGLLIACSIASTCCLSYVSVSILIFLIFLFIVDIFFNVSTINCSLLKDQVVAILLSLSNKVMIDFNLPVLISLINSS